MTIAKAFGWWEWAAGSHVPHIARVDDDTFLHVPRLEAALNTLRCHERLVFGMLANVGYNPTTFTKCGYSWKGHGNWRRYGCAKGGSHTPNLFPSGMLQVLSHPLVLSVVTSPMVREFVRRATHLIVLDTWDRTEDVALGFWLQQLLAENVLPEVSFVRAYNNELHNLGCKANKKHAGLYRWPDKTKSMVVHYVKRPQGMSYVKAVVDGERQHEPKPCMRASGVS